MKILEKAWARCFTDLGGSQPPPCTWEELLARYSEPQRAYHTVQHLEECFAWFEQTYDLARKPGEVAFALFYHDAVYDPRASDNEKQSSELAVSVLEEYVRGDSDARRAASLIMATVHSAIPQDADTQILIDIDLSILGSDATRFDQYEQQVRVEYGWIEPQAFRDGRTRILKQFLDRPRIYSTEFFHAKLEERARTNLKLSIAKLAAQAS